MVGMGREGGGSFIDFGAGVGSVWKEERDMNSEKWKGMAGNMSEIHFLFPVWKPLKPPVLFL